MAKARAVGLDQTAKAGLGPANVAFEAPARIQTNLLAASERRLLDELCRLMPAWITPDRLTAIGSVGAAVAAIGYVASNWRPGFLFVSSLGLVLNWFGDSLDGSLARHRRIERPRYGYFLDSSVDALNVLFFAVGLGLSPYVSMSAALLLLCSYYLLMHYVLLSAQVFQKHDLTKVYLGPTELRLLAMAFNTVIWVVGPLGVSLAGFSFSIYSALVVAEAVAFIVVFATEVWTAARRLRREEVARRPPC